MKRKIVVVGSSNTDMIVKLSHLPKPGETVINGSLAMAPGGTGATPELEKHKYCCSFVALRQSHLFIIF